MESAARQSRAVPFFKTAGAVAPEEDAFPDGIYAFLSLRLIQIRKTAPKMATMISGIRPPVE